MRLFRFTDEQCRTFQALVRTSGLKQKDVAETLGISESNLSRILSGSLSCSWDIEEWDSLARLLKMERSKLISAVGLVDMYNLATDEDISTVFVECRDGGRMIDGTFELHPYDSAGVPCYILPAGKPASSFYIITAETNALAPDICKGDLLVLDRTVKEFKDEGVYALVIDGYLYLRRASLPFRGEVVLTAKDPSADPPLRINSSRERMIADHIEMLGRVVGVMRGM